MRLIVGLLAGLVVLGPVVVPSVVSVVSVISLLAALVPVAAAETSSVAHVHASETTSPAETVTSR